MSNNLIPHQYRGPDRQMIEFHVSDKLDMPLSDVHIRTDEHSATTPALHEFAVSNEQMGFIEPLVSSSRSQNALLSNIQSGQVDPRLGVQGSQQCVTPNQHFVELRTLFNNQGLPISSLSTKRKAEVEAVGSLSVSQESPMPNKRVAQVGSLSHSIGLLHPSAMSKKGVQMQAKVSSPTTQTQTANKKMLRNDSGKTGSQRIQTPKGRISQIEPTSKLSTESIRAVRSKMRESLAAALEMACQNEDKSANEENNKTVNASHQTSEIIQPPRFDLCASGDVSTNFENIQNASSPKDTNTDSPTNGQRSAAGFPSGENMGDSDQGYKDFQCGSLLANDDASFTDNFFIKDELLQGNGLTWAWEIDMGSRTNEVVNDVTSEIVDEDIGGVTTEQVRASPQDLAFKIEEELFKLFGGVNKKYKEKGRSLLFNLKDRSNPELRERVMSGEISPGRLCSMTAEELASKELSRWRMAKAEEFAQMVVLPDTDVNMRRLVKKTHKGEYQVEVEKDENIATDVSTGTSSIVQSRQKEEPGARIPSEDDRKDKDLVTVQKAGAENQDLSGRLIIPNDGTDLMHGMIEEEMKDADFLPPIVSLDEFMESLDSEPPFNDLPVDAEQRTPLSDKKKSEVREQMVTANKLSKHPVDTLLDKSKKEDKGRTDSDAAEKSKQSPIGRKISARGTALMAEYLWQGSLQLNISSSVMVTGIFRSGEKTSTKEWPDSLEVKGRVRLDAFEKFLQELPMSRSRAVMVLHFSLKDSTSENERLSLSEAVDSYVSDERLGFAEPSPGLELYLCPPQGKIVDMLVKYLSKDRGEILNSTDNGLIGVVVWRKAPLSTSISPNSSTRHKTSLKRQHSSSRRQNEQEGINVNGNLTPTGPVAHPLPNPPPQDDDDDDIPPGFGPGGARDDDDLPEFNFSGNVNHHSVNRVPPQNALGLRVASVNQQSSYRPVDQMRELVQKYGQTMSTPNRDDTGLGLGLEPWDDDDDDIPEWKPQPPSHRFRQPMQPHGVTHVEVGRQQFPRPPATPQHLHSAHTQYGWTQGPAYGHPGRPVLTQHVSLGNQAPPGQQYNRMPVQAGQPTDWRQGTPRSRAF